jgi:probable rRNA maturation factor
MSDDLDPSSRDDFPQVSVAVTLLDPDWPRDLPAVEHLARRAAEAAIVTAAASGVAEAALSSQDAEISLVLADDATLRRHNRDYRNIDKPTNVLAFATLDSSGVSESGGPLLLGDVLLSRETLTQEAGEQGKRPADHFCHLVVHGVLHLLGQDHQSEAEARVMEGLEVAALGRLGVADPYAAAHAPFGAPFVKVCG